MNRHFELNDLKQWLSTASVSDTQYYRTRRQLFQSFNKISTNNPDDNETDVEIDRQLYNSIRSFLTTRNEHMSDNKTLAFETALSALEEHIESLSDQAPPLAPVPNPPQQGQQGFNAPLD